MSFPAAPADPTQFGFTDAPGGAAAPPPVAESAGQATEPERQSAESFGQEPGSAVKGRPGRLPVQLSTALIEFARAAAGLDAESTERVGDYLGATAEDDVAVSAAFAAADRGYRGWCWSVTLAVLDPERPTVSEVVLLPGDEALLAPAWVPWERRIRPGDVGAGDLLPTPADDVRLVPSYVDSADPALAELAYEFGLGRVRVLSREGRDEAADRWHEGFGPDSPIAIAAQAHCVTCGFYLPLAGLLGQALGACGNEFSPADGRVVDAEFGCGAHSETVIDAPLISASTETVIDELALEVHDRPVPAGAEWDSQVQDAAAEDGMLEALTDGTFHEPIGVIGAVDVGAVDVGAVDVGAVDVGAVDVATADADAFAAAVEEIAAVDASLVAAANEVIVVDSVGDAVVVVGVAEAADPASATDAEPVGGAEPAGDGAPNDVVS